MRDDNRINPKLAGEIGAVIHVGITTRRRLVQHDPGQDQSATRDGLDGQQGLVDGAEPVGAYDQHRQTEGHGQVGIQGIDRERRIESAGALHQQKIPRADLFTTCLDQVIQAQSPPLQGRRALGRERLAKPVRPDTRKRLPAPIAA